MCAIKHVCSLINPVSSKIFNFDKDNEQNVNNFLQHISILPCNCEFFDFIDKDHQGLIRFFTKDFKYGRKSNRIILGKPKLSTFESLND